MALIDFKDKIVIVTGSSSGIGATTAAHFAKLSATLVIVGRNEERLRTAAKTVEEAKGIKPLVIKADLTKDDDIRKIVDETVKTFGRIDVLVNNAGAGRDASIHDGIEAFDYLISVNLRSVYLLTSLVAPHLIKSKGNIVNISSIASKRILPELLPYCVSKAGLDTFTKIVAKDLATKGVRVNSVNPGPVKTNFHDAAGYDKEKIEEFFNDRNDKALLGRISDCDDVAEMIVFLASDKAKSVTGCIHVVDAGNLLN